MALDLDMRQEMSNACGTVAEMTLLWYRAFLAAGIPEDLACTMVSDWFRLTIVPGMAPDPFSDIKATMDKLLGGDDDRA